MKRITTPRRPIVALLVLAALVLVGVATVTATAGTRRLAAAPSPTCSIGSVAGAWGYNFDGWNTNGVLTPFAGAGRAVVDGQGNVSGTETTSPNFLGGNGAAAATTGTVSVNADCTGTLTVTVYDQSNTVIRRTVWAVVYVDNETAMRATLVSLGLGPNLFNVTNVSATLNADKLFPPTDQ